MNRLPQCHLFTQDPDLAMRVMGCLHGAAEVIRTGPGDDPLPQLEQFDPAVLMVDLRTGASMRVIDGIREAGLRTVVLGLVPGKAGHAAEAGGTGLFAVDTLDAGHDRLRSLFMACRRHAVLVEENAMLRKDAATGRAPPQAGEQAQPAARLGTRLADLAHALRRFDRPDAMLDNIVEWIANCAMLSRAGIFAQSRNGGVFRFRAGLRHLPATAALEFAKDAPLVRWMQMHAHLVSRASADAEPDLATRRMLAHALSAHGAEVLAPLHGQSGVIGWLFAGRRATGQMLSQEDLEELALLTELVSIAAENSLLHEDVTLQKTRAEAVLHSIPVGIVCAGEDAVVEWFNAAAEENLDVAAADAVGRPVEKVDSRLADLLRRCLAEGGREASAEWTQNRNHRILSVVVRRLTNAGRGLGAMGIVRDLTPERQLMEQRRQQERMAYWCEMILAISHEVRNPLVAINTFAQLLPERYDDPAFRDEFAGLATREIRRLNALLEQLQSFAAPRALVRDRAGIPGMLSTAIGQARVQANRPGVTLELSDAAGLPEVNADREALTDAFARVMLNAVEAAPEPSTVTVGAAAEPGPDGAGLLVVKVSDRGPGIPAPLLEDVFSPFFTTKTRGIGLGLPVARRVAIEHGGKLDIETGPGGTTVVFRLPAAGETRADEARTGG